MERIAGFGLVAAVAAATVANAQDVRFFLAYGDPATAARNGSTVGTEINPSTPLKMGPIGSTTVVSLWVLNTSSKRLSYGGGEVFVGVDRRVAPSTKTNSFGVSTQGRLSADRFFNLGTNLPGISNRGLVTPANVSPLGNSFSGSGEAGTSLRSFGPAMGFGFGLGISVVLTPGTKVRIGDIPIRNVSLLPGMSYGNANDNGITLNGINGALRGTNFLGADRGGWARTTVKYSPIGSF